MKRSFHRGHKNLLSALGVILLLVAGLSGAFGQHYTPVEKGSKVEFSVNVKGSTPKKIKGTINKAKGKITFNPKHLNLASFDITLDAGVINTGDATINSKLKGFSFFNIMSFPSIHFVSVAVKQDRPGSIVYTVDGNLTMKGITKPAKMQFTTTPTGKSFLFRGTMMIDRLAYGIGDQGDIDKYVTVFVEMATK